MSDELEAPFGTKPIGLPIQAMPDTIEIEMRG